MNVQKSNEQKQEKTYQNINELQMTFVFYSSLFTHRTYLEIILFQLLISNLMYFIDT